MTQIWPKILLGERLHWICPYFPTSSSRSPQQRQMPTGSSLHFQLYESHTSLLAQATPPFHSPILLQYAVYQMLTSSLAQTPGKQKLLHLCMSLRPNLPSDRELHILLIQRLPNLFGPLPIFRGKNLLSDPLQVYLTRVNNEKMPPSCMQDHYYVLSPETVSSNCFGSGAIPSSARAYFRFCPQGSILVMPGGPCGAEDRAQITMYQLSNTDYHPLWNTGQMSKIMAISYTDL